MVPILNHLGQHAIYSRLRNCPYTLQTFAGWAAIIFADQPVRHLQVHGQVLNLPLYAWLTDNFRTTSPYFSKSVLNLETVAGWRTILGPPLKLLFSTWWTYAGWRTIMTLWHKPEDLCRLTDNFRTSGNSLDEFYLNLETYAGERTIFGPNTKLSKSMETSAGWRTYRFGILPILLNLETFAGWRTIVGKNVWYKLLLAVKHTGAHGLKYMTLGNTKKHGSVQSQALFGAEIWMFVWGLWGILC